MFLFAFDEQEKLISADQAHKQKDYFCRECGGIVRCRGGFLRQIHFYHLETNRICRQSGKSLIHLQIQFYIQSRLSVCELEKRFALINRIGDVVWEKEKLVYEIQCSPITAREIEERNRDYQSLGYQTIWILHDHLYNKNRLTAAEYFLQESPHYFTNINREGEGYIYDQWDWIEKSKRLKTLYRKEINIASHHTCEEGFFPKTEYPKWFLKRIRTWPLFFSGDCIDYLLSCNEEEKANFLSLYKESKMLYLLEINQPSLWEKLKRLISLLILPSRLTLHLIIEKLTR